MCITQQLQCRAIIKAHLLADFFGATLPLKLIRSLTWFTLRRNAPLTLSLSRKSDGLVILFKLLVLLVQFVRFFRMWVGVFASVHFMKCRKQKSGPCSKKKIKGSLKLRTCEIQGAQHNDFNAKNKSFQSPGATGLCQGTTTLKK